MAQTKRRTTTKRKAAPRKRKPQPKADMSASWSILLFGLAILVAAMTYVPGASAWAWLRMNVLFGVFGVSTYLLAPALVYLAILVAMGRRRSSIDIDLGDAAMAQNTVKHEEKPEIGPGGTFGMYPNPYAGSMPHGEVLDAPFVDKLGLDTQVPAAPAAPHMQRSAQVPGQTAAQPVAPAQPADELGRLVHKAAGAPQPEQAQASSATARRQAKMRLKRFKTQFPPVTIIWSMFMIHALQRIVKCPAPCYNGNKNF